MVLEDQEASAEAAGESETEAETPAADSEAATGEANQSEQESAAAGKSEGGESMEDDEKRAGQAGEEEQEDGATAAAAAAATGAREPKAWTVTVENLDKVNKARPGGGAQGGKLDVVLSAFFCPEMACRTDPCPWLVFTFCKLKFYMGEA